MRSWPLLPFCRLNGRNFVSLLLFVTSCYVQSSDVRMPPKIVRGPLNEKIYRDGDQVKLDCLAVGSPTPKISWFKNGILLEPRPTVHHFVDCLVFTSLSDVDEGYYKCYARNKYGVSVSSISILRRAVLGSLLPGSVKEELTLEEGMPFVLRHEPITCYPSPTFTWWTMSNTTDQSPQPLVTTKRVQIDNEGNLHFAYLLTVDDLAGGIYKINVRNPFLDKIVGGSFMKLHIADKGGPKNIPPRPSFVSKSPVVAVMGQEVRIRCFFSGYPAPVLSWYKDGGPIMSTERYKQFDFNTTFEISNVRPSDEGEYVCNASNLAGSEYEIIRIDVQTAPVFLTPADRSTNTNVTEGDDVAFNCNATAEPEAEAVWFVNGRPISRDDLPARMQLSHDDKHLTISRVCKTCQPHVDNRTTDLMVIQCNASNVHGFVFTDSYLNILERTVITRRPIDVNLKFNDTAVAFHCDAQSDPATAVELSWFKFHVNSWPSTPLRTTEMISISADQSQLSFNVSRAGMDMWQIFLGKYKCLATNGYSTDQAEFSMNVDFQSPSSNADLNQLAASETPSELSLDVILGTTIPLVIIIAVSFIMITLLLFKVRRRRRRYTKKMKAMPPTVKSVSYRERTSRTYDNIYDSPDETTIAQVGQLTADAYDGYEELHPGTIATPPSPRVYDSIDLRVSASKNSSLSANESERSRIIQPYLSLIADDMVEDAPSKVCSEDGANTKGQDAASALPPNDLSANAIECTDSSPISTNYVVLKAIKSGRKKSLASVSRKVSQIAAASKKPVIAVVNKRDINYKQKSSSQSLSNNLSQQNECAPSKSLHTSRGVRNQLSLDSQPMDKTTSQYRWYRATKSTGESREKIHSPTESSSIERNTRETAP